MAYLEEVVGKDKVPKVQGKSNLVARLRENNEERDLLEKNIHELMGTA
jgi:hypothetical protein